ncbi:MAG: metallophosphoesterase [Saprospiraceae bacterium]|nr:metallophosphoesterase [Saprospiraceae bacterium]
MRLIILLFLLVGIDYYAFQAVKISGVAWPKSFQLVFNALYIFSSVYAYFYIISSATNLVDWRVTKAGQYLRALVFIIFASKFVISLFLGVDDLRRAITWIVNQFSSPKDFSLSRSRFLSQLGVLAGAIPMISLTYGMWRNPYRYQIHNHRVGINNLAKGLTGFRIVQISDIHSGTFTSKEPLKNAIRIINDLKADIVLFTGDMVNNVAQEMKPYMDVFSGIEAKYGVYSVLGNHDYGDYHQWRSLEEKQANFRELIDIHDKLGWDLLRNEHRMLAVEAHKVAVIGVENSSASPRFQNYGDLKKAYQGTEEADLKLLLSHDPSHWDAEVQSFEDIALTFSGHTHGFQFGIEIPGWLKWSPSKYVYKQWAGLYTTGTQHLYVNRGFGMLGYPGRVGILPEITCIDLYDKVSDTI